ncbi:MAG: hypothetical protein V1773_01155 [bacterium]
MKLKRKTIYVLLITIFLMLIVEIIVQSIYTVKKVKVKSNFYPGEISKTFLANLEEYGILQEWVKERVLKDKNTDSTYIDVVIKTPSDLQIVDLLTSLNEKFYYGGIDISSQELKINGDTKLSLTLNNNLILKAFFKFDKKLNRKSIDIAVIVDGLEDLNKNEIDGLLSTPTNISFTVLPSDKAEELLKLIVKNGKDYLIKLDDDIDDNQFVLNSDQHPEKIIKSLQKILSVYNRTNFIYVNDESDLYNSKIFNFIKRNIPRGYVFKKKKELITLGDREPEELKSIFRYYCEKPDLSYKIFYLTTAQFFIVKNDILRMKKRGNSIISPSRLFAKQNVEE